MQRATYQDLELQPLVDAASQDDDFIAKMMTKSFFEPLTSQPEIAYRQATLQYALQEPDYFKQIYQICGEIDYEVRHRLWIIDEEAATYSLSSSVSLTKIYLGGIQKIIAAAKTTTTLSPAVQQFQQRLNNIFGNGQMAAMLQLLNDLNNNHFYGVEGHLEANFSTAVGEREIQHVNHFVDRLTEKLRLGTRKVTFEINPRDDNGSQAVVRLGNRASFKSAQSIMTVFHILKAFFNELRAQTAWLVGMTQLAQPLANQFCYPTMTPKVSGQGIKNVVLLLSQQIGQVIGNDLDIELAPCLVITGANQGGKTTFLRALGQAALMANAGMFVCATQLTLPGYTNVWTHFKREEDTAVASGKLDDELKRMATIVQQLGPHDLILMNESFSSTNEHEGSTINFEVTKGLLARQATVFSVSHQYEYTQLLKQATDLKPVFMRAQRSDDGARSFQILPGPALKTSFGLDIFRKKFKAEANVTVPLLEKANSTISEQTTGD